MNEIYFSKLSFVSKIVAVMLLREPTAKESNGSKKTIALICAIVTFATMILAFMIIELSGFFEEEPEVIARVVTPVKEQQPKMQKKTVMKQVKQASASSAASPIAKMIRSNTTAQIVAPKVTRVTDGPLGLGEGEFGDGFGGGTGNGMGSGATMFGSAGSSGLIGRLFDMKQTAERTAKPYDPSVNGYFQPMRRFIDKKFSDRFLEDYYEANVKLSFTFLAIPNIDANEGPKAFQAEKEIQPRGWFIHYKGDIDPPEEGLYRFHGMFDDMLIVFVNGNPVLDASWDDCLQKPTVRERSALPTFMSNRPIFQGKWVNIRRGSNVVILVGERPGGRLGGTLMIEKKGENYKKRGDGSPILPLFTTMKIDKSAKEMIEKTGYQYADDAPVFRPASTRSFF